MSFPQLGKGKIPIEITNYEPPYNRKVQRMYNCDETTADKYGKIQIPPGNYNKIRTYDKIPRGFFKTGEPKWGPAKYYLCNTSPTLRENFELMQYQIESEKAKPLNLWCDSGAFQDKSYTYNVSSPKEKKIFWCKPEPSIWMG